VALGHLTPGSRGRCVRPNNLAALVEGAPRGACPPPAEEEEEEEEEEESAWGGSVCSPHGPTSEKIDSDTSHNAAVIRQLNEFHVHIFSLYI